MEQQQPRSALEEKCEDCEKQEPPRPTRPASSSTTSKTTTPTDLKFPRIAITFCLQCRWTLRAAYFAQELLSTFSSSIGEIALIPTTGGIFTVNLSYRPTPPNEDDGGKQDEPAEVREVLLWDRKAEGGFPETKVLKQLVRNFIVPEKNLGHSDRKSTKAAPADSNSVSIANPAPVAAPVTDSRDQLSETTAAGALDSTSAPATLPGDQSSSTNADEPSPLASATGTEDQPSSASTAAPLTPTSAVVTNGDGGDPPSGPDTDTTVPLDPLVEDAVANAAAVSDIPFPVVPIDPTAPPPPAADPLMHTAVRADSIAAPLSVKIHLARDYEESQLEVQPVSPFSNGIIMTGNLAAGWQAEGEIP